MNKWKKLRKQNLGQIPTEASINLTAPETAPLRKNDKVNIRTKPLNFKVSEEFYWQLKELALKEKHLMVEIVEKSLECYKQHCSKVNPSSNKDKERQIFPKSKTVPKPTQELNQFWKVNFDCDKCYQRFEKSRVYSLAPDLDQLKHYPTYCADCNDKQRKITNEETEENNRSLFIPKKSDKPCSFSGVDDKTKKQVLCDKPVFDKKKQLCRSHNKQVWKRFHEFTKDMSVSSTAAWYETWEQSGDWRYFWNLKELAEKEKK